MLPDWDHYNITTGSCCERWNSRAVHIITGVLYYHKSNISFKADIQACKEQLKYTKYCSKTLEAKVRPWIVNQKRKYFFPKLKVKLFNYRTWITCSTTILGSLYTHVHMCVFVSVCVCVCTCVNVWVCVCMFTCVCVCVFHKKSPCFVYNTFRHIHSF